MKDIRLFKTTLKSNKQVIKLTPKWVNWLGIISAVIYLLAQSELFATVMKGFPAWDMAGFIGITVWLVWLIIVGIIFINKRNQNL